MKAPLKKCLLITVDVQKCIVDDDRHDLGDSLDRIKSLRDAAYENGLSCWQVRIDPNPQREVTAGDIAARRAALAPMLPDYLNEGVFYKSGQTQAPSDNPRFAASLKDIRPDIVLVQGYYADKGVLDTADYVREVLNELVYEPYIAIATDCSYPMLETEHADYADMQGIKLVDSERLVFADGQLSILSPHATRPASRPRPPRPQNG